MHTEGVSILREGDCEAVKLAVFLCEVDLNVEIIQCVDLELAARTIRIVVDLVLSVQPAVATVVAITVEAVAVWCIA